jgi:AcrR family transcriptional regulator
MARPLSDAARVKMIQATQEIIALHGLDAFTIDEVARRSGVAKTTIYRHFRTGDELVLAAVDDMIEHIEPPDTGALRGDLRAVIGSFLEIAGVPSLRQMFVSILNRSIIDDEFAAAYRNVKEQRHQPLQLVLQRAIARGDIDPDIDLELALQFVQGPFVAKRVIENEDVTDRDIEILLDFVCRGLAPAR